MIDGTGKRIVIIGGGEVGARKARFFAGEGDVMVYSRSFHPSFPAIPVTCVTTELSADRDSLLPLIEGAFLVITTTPDVILNNTLTGLCRERGILCNNASGERGDVLLPAKITGERYCIAFSTSGSGPAISRLLRETIEESFPGLDAMIGLMDSIRPILKSRIETQEEREAVISRILRDSEVWSAAGQSVDSAITLVRERYAV